MCPGFATRTGVFPYMDGAGKVRLELRHPDDVFDPASLATLKYAPVTIEHPPIMLDPKNVSEYSVGHTTERVEVNREMVDTDLIIEHQDAIDAVEKGSLRELSSGYTADIVEEEGVYNGAPYNARQKNIRYNHLAIVKRGRAGPEVRLRLDSADAVMQGSVSKPKEAIFTGESAVSDSDGGVAESKKVVIMGREVDLPSDVADAVQDLLDRFDEMRAKQFQLEESMSAKAKKAQRADVDINQKGVSPQVKVEQQGPDGRGAAGKDPADKKVMPGQSKAHEDDEEMDEDEHGVSGGVKSNSKAEGSKELADDDEEHEKEHDDDEEEEEHDDDEPAAGKGGGAMQSPLDLLRKDMESLQKKMDEFAASSMNQGEKKPDGEKMDSATVEKRARARAKLERQAEKLVPMSISNKFDSMSDREIYAAVIKHRHPKADLEGKKLGHLQARFDGIVESISEEQSNKRTDTGRALFGINGGRMDSEERQDADPNQARRNMVAAGRDLWKQPLSGSKK